jgi:hypothetical protein
MVAVVVFSEAKRNKRMSRSLERVEERESESRIVWYKEYIRGPASKGVRGGVKKRKENRGG